MSFATTAVPEIPEGVRLYSELPLKSWDPPKAAIEVLINGTWHKWQVPIASREQLAYSRVDLGILAVTKLVRYAYYHKYNQSPSLHKFEQELMAWGMGTLKE